MPAICGHGVCVVGGGNIMWAGWEREPYPVKGGVFPSLWVPLPGSVCEVSGVNLTPAFSKLSSKKVFSSN